MLTCLRLAFYAIVIQIFVEFFVKQRILERYVLLFSSRRCRSRLNNLAILLVAQDKAKVRGALQYWRAVIAGDSIVI